MVEQATFLLQKLEFENMVMSMLIINPDFPLVDYRQKIFAILPPSLFKCSK